MMILHTIQTWTEHITGKSVADSCIIYPLLRIQPCRRLPSRHSLHHRVRLATVPQTAHAPPPPQGRLAAGDRTRPPYCWSRAAVRQDRTGTSPLASPYRHFAPSSSAPASSSVSTSFHFVRAASRCFKCFRCFMGMMQIFHTNIAKVARDVVYVGMLQ
jgi:hypothetical protein